MFAIPPQFNSAHSFSEGLACAGSLTRRGFIDTSGKFIIPQQYKPFKVDPVFSHGLTAFKVKKQWGYIDKEGNTVVEPKFTDAREFRAGLARVAKGSQTCFINLQGDIAFETSYYPASWFSNDFVLAHLESYSPVGNKKIPPCGFLDQSGQVTIPVEYESAMPFSEQLAPVQIDQKWAFIDEANQLVVELRFQEAYGFEEGLAAVKEHNRWGYIDRQGHYAILPQFN